MWSVSKKAPHRIHKIDSSHLAKAMQNSTKSLIITLILRLADVYHPSLARKCQFYGKGYLLSM